MWADFEDRNMWNRSSYVLMVIAALAILSLAAQAPAQNLRIEPPGWESPSTESPPWVIDPMDFGEIAIGDSAVVDFRLISVGPPPIAIFAVNLIDNAGGAFAITDISPIPPDLEMGDWVDVEVTYAPLDLGVHTATLRIVSNDRELPVFDGPLTGNSVPEPSSLLLFATVLGLSGAARKRR